MIDVTEEVAIEKVDLDTMISLRIPMQWLFAMDTIIQTEGGDRSKLLRELLTTPRHIPVE